MKHTLWLILPILCLDVSMLHAAPEDAHQFPESLRDPTFLRHLTWLADKRIESVVAGWPEYSGAQGFQDKIVHRHTRIRILESLFDAEYRTYKTKADGEIVMYGGAGEVTADCDALSTWVEQVFGRPEKVVDLGMPNRLADKSADWLFGETRVQFVCGGVWIEREFIPAAVALRYNRRDRLAALEDPIQLECSSQERYVGGISDKTVRDGPPVVFILDPNWHRVLRANKSPFGKTEKFTDGEIVAAQEDEKAVSRIRFDRVTGSYLLSIRLKAGSGGLEKWGKCVRVDPGKKF